MVGENGRNPVKNLPRPRFVHHETHMEEPRRELGTPAVGGERLTACVTRPPLLLNIKPIYIYLFHAQLIFKLTKVSLIMREYFTEYLLIVQCISNLFI